MDRAWHASPLQNGERSKISEKKICWGGSQNFDFEGGVQFFQRESENVLGKQKEKC